MYGDISLKMTDTYGSPLKQAAVGQPFKIEAVVSDNAHLGSAPAIKGLKQFDILSNSTHISIINGRPTAKYSYEVMGNQPGVFYVGPAQFSNAVQSNVLKVVVDAVEIETDKGRKKYRNHDEAADHVFVQLKTDKQKVSVGEKVGCSLKFCYLDPSTSIRNFSTQESSAFKVLNSQNAQQSTESIDGKEYYCVEWKWDLYPTKAGKLIVPAYAANYEQQSERDNLWGGLGRFFGNRVETRRAYSNSVSLDVDPIPESDCALNGIGSFSYIHLSVQPPVARQGDGILVTVEIGGEGDPDTIEFGTLQNIPDALKAYQSNQTVISPVYSGDILKKKIEFVIQGLATGSFEIPAQQFHYYDVYARKFKTIESAPLTITILPALKKNTIKSDDNTKHVEELTSEIRGIHQGFGSVPSAHSVIPYWLFVCLVLFPVGVLLVLYSIHELKGYLRRRPIKRSLQAYKIASNQLEKLKNDNKAEKIYSVFIEYFANKSEISLTMITPSFINSLIDQKFDEGNQGEWDKFFDAVTQRAFGAQFDKEYDKNLFKQAEQWMKLLEKHL